MPGRTLSRNGRIMARALTPQTTLTPPENSPPTAPTGLTASGVSQTSLTLTWTASTDTGGSGLAGYLIYRDVSGSDVEIGFSTTTTFNVTGLTAGTTYTFRVKALDNAGNISSAASISVSTTAAVDTTAPTDPTSFTSTSVTTTTLTLTWAASTDTQSGVKGYHVYQVISGVDTELTVAGSPTTGTTWNVTGLTAGTSYTFKVEAEDNSGNRSNKVSHTVSTTAAGDTTPPTVPTNLATGTITATTIPLTWTASTDNVAVANYRVVKVVGGANVLVGTPTGTSFTVSDLTASTEYTLRVRAEDTSGNASAFTSITASTIAATDTTAPSAPTNLAASSITQTTLTLGWTASTDDVAVTGYTVSEFTTGTGYGTTTSTSMNITGLTAGTSYVFLVAAFDAAGNTSSVASLAVSTASPATSGPPAVLTRLVNHPFGLAAGDLSTVAQLQTVLGDYGGKCGLVRMSAAQSIYEATARNFVWTLQVNGATGGTFSLNVDVNGTGWQETAAIAYNASNATIQTRIVDLSNVPAGSVTVSGTTTKTITFAGDLAGDVVWMAWADDNLTPAAATVNVAVTPFTTTGTVPHQKAAAIRAVNAKVLAMTGYSVAHARRTIKLNGTTGAGKVTVSSVTSGIAGVPTTGLPAGYRWNVLSIDGPGLSSSATITGRDGNDLQVNGVTTTGQTGEFTIGLGGGGDDFKLAKDPVKYGGYVGRMVASDIAPDIVELDNEINWTSSRRPFPDPIHDAKCLCHSYLRAKSVNPNIQIIGAGVSNTPGWGYTYPGDKTYACAKIIWDYYTEMWDWLESSAGQAYWHPLRDMLPAGVESSDTYPLDGIAWHAYEYGRATPYGAGNDNYRWPTDPSYTAERNELSNPFSFLPAMQAEMISRDPDWLGRIPFYLTEQGVPYHQDATTGVGLRIALVEGCTVTAGSNIVTGPFNQAGLAALLVGNRVGITNSNTFPPNATVTAATSTQITVSANAAAGSSGSNKRIVVLGLSSGSTGDIHYDPIVASASEGFIHTEKCVRIMSGDLPWPYTATSPKWSPSSVWRYTITATGGNYKWIVQVGTGTAQTTAAIAWNASNATIQTAIENLSNVPTGCVAVSGASTTKTVTFKAPGGSADPGLNDSDVTITLTASTLTGGSITGPTDVGIRPNGMPRGRPPIANYCHFCAVSPSIDSTNITDGFLGFYGFFDEKKDKSGTTRDFSGTPQPYASEPQGNDPFDSLGLIP